MLKKLNGNRCVIFKMCHNFVDFFCGRRLVLLESLFYNLSNFGGRAPDVQPINSEPCMSALGDL